VSVVQVVDSAVSNGKALSHDSSESNGKIAGGDSSVNGNGKKSPPNPLVII